MSLIKFLLGASLSQRKRWKHEEEEKNRSILKVNLADPEERRHLMNCIAFSPGIPSDDRRFVDIWGDDSLTISESSFASENVVTVVEIHAAEEEVKQEETTVDEAPNDELNKEKLEFIDKEAVVESAVNFAVQKTAEAQADGEDKSSENIEEFELVEQKVKREEEQREAESAVDVDEKENLGETCAVTVELDERVGLIADLEEQAVAIQTSEDCDADEEVEVVLVIAAQNLEASDSDSVEGDVTQAESSTAEPTNSDEEGLPDQIVPELPGLEHSTCSTTLTPASSIEMHTQTDLASPAGAPRETETQTDESSKLPSVVSVRQSHLFKPYCDPYEMELLSAALDELDMAKSPPKLCNCSGNARPSPTTLNLSFSTEKNREIARENANLLSRLQRTNVRVLRQSLLSGPPESSASINRRKQQERIQRENLILLRKITAARGKGRGRNNTLLSYY